MSDNVSEMTLTFEAQSTVEQVEIRLYAREGTLQSQVRLRLLAAQIPL